MQNVLTETNAHRARVTLNRADKMNPLDWATVRELREVVDQLERQPELRTVVITGAGRSFSAGGDLQGYLALYRRPDDFQRFLDDFYALLDAIERSSRIYIAAVNGACVAGGLELMLACDLILASDTARIGDGHLNFGQLPGAGGSQRLPRTIGIVRAKQLMFSGDLITADQAERIGLVGEVVAADRLLARADELAAGMASKSRAGLKGMKHLVNEGLRGELEAGLKLEIKYVHAYATTEPDATEGLLAFAEKRPPVYRNH
jgi:enoyl-CoA hydratase/carnithine racemase